MFWALSLPTLIPRLWIVKLLGISKSCLIPFPQYLQIPRYFCLFYQYCFLSNLFRVLYSQLQVGYLSNCRFVFHRISSPQILLQTMHLLSSFSTVVKLSAKNWVLVLGFWFSIRQIYFFSPPLQSFS